MLKVLQKFMKNILKNRDITLPTKVHLVKAMYVCIMYACAAAAAAANSLQLCLTLCDPIDSSPPDSAIPGILQARTLECSPGLPFPSPMHESEKWKWSRSVVSNSLRPHGLQPTRLLHPSDFPVKSTGVGCIAFSNGCESWTIKKDECQRIDAFELGCWRRLLRVHGTARRSDQSILKEISPEYPLEGLMLKLKLQYFGH